MSQVKIRATGSLARVATSDALAEQLETIARPVLESAKNDPNAYYVSTLRMKRFVSRGRRGRVSIQIGAAPVIGAQVEAKRGTLHRALGNAGL